MRTRRRTLPRGIGAGAILGTAPLRVPDGHKHDQSVMAKLGAYMAEAV